MAANEPTPCKGHQAVVMETLGSAATEGFLGSSPPFLKGHALKPMREPSECRRHNCARVGIVCSPGLPLGHDCHHEPAVPALDGAHDLVSRPNTQNCDVSQACCWPVVEHAQAPRGAKYACMEAPALDGTHVEASAVTIATATRRHTQNAFPPRPAFCNAYSHVVDVHPWQRP